MKKYMKIKFKLPIKKFTEEHIDNVITAWEYLKSLNKKEYKKIEEEAENIMIDKMTKVIIDFFKTFIKGIRYYKKPMEIFYIPKESALILTNKEVNDRFQPTREIALEQLKIIEEAFGCDLAYYGVEVLTAYQIVEQFIEQQQEEKNE